MLKKCVKKKSKKSEERRSRVEKVGLMMGVWEDYGKKQKEGKGSFCGEWGVLLEIMKPLKKVRDVERGGVVGEEV